MNTHKCQSICNVLSTDTEPLYPVSAKTCNSGFEYRTGQPSCYKTCANVYVDLHEDCYDNIVSGCFCPEGMYLDENHTCIMAHECKCKLQDRYYSHGDEAYMACNPW